MTTNDLAADQISEQLQTYSQRQFTGRVDIQAPNTWSLYFCLGRLVWATGGLHPHRRWHRNLSQYCPQIPPGGIRSRQTDISMSWEYQLLTILVKRQMIPGEQAVAIIKNTLAEILFDIFQYQHKEKLTFTSDPQDVLDASLTLINPSQALQEAQQAWDSWFKAGLANLSPNVAPVVKQPQQLQKLASPRVYQTLVKAVNGKRTLRDLAVQAKQDLIVLTRSLLPYIRQQVIGVVKIADLPGPSHSSVAPQQQSRPADEPTSRQAKEPTSRPADQPTSRQAKEPTSRPADQPTSRQAKEPTSQPADQPTSRQAKEPTSRPADEQVSQGVEEQKKISQSPVLSPEPPVPNLQPPTYDPKLHRPLVVYVEDSVQDCKMMEDILTKARYGFISIEDSIQALPLLLQHKPDLILLDLVMPVANGYEICAQIRRISSFKNTPVIILTGNDGIVDRVRAKMVGATDFLGKPIVPQKVLTTLLKYSNTHPSLTAATQPLAYQTS